MDDVRRSWFLGKYRGYEAHLKEPASGKTFLEVRAPDNRAFTSMHLTAMEVKRIVDTDCARTQTLVWKVKQLTEEIAAFGTEENQSRAV
jgi:hypothetical protein